jgi:hypothetical protein
MSGMTIYRAKCGNPCDLIASDHVQAHGAVRPIPVGARCLDTFPNGPFDLR